MRKLNATLLSGENKEDAILKIKDESFAITTEEQLIKIPYSNIKSYNYDEQKEVLSIVKFGGNPIELNIVKDRQLLELLNNIIKQNKNNSNESISNFESTSLKEKNAKLEENTTIRNTDYEKKEIKQSNEDKKEPNNDWVTGLIAVVVIIGIVVFGVKNLFFSNSNHDDNTKSNTEEKLDDMQGSWYLYDKKTGVKGNTTYMEFDGKGFWTFHSNGYVFGSDGSYTYKINEKDIILYKDNKEDFKCSIQTNSNQIMCFRGGVEVYGK